MDRRYVRRGASKPTRKQRLYGLAAIILCISLVAYFGARGVPAESLGALTANLLMFVFFLWEVGRWRVRRRNPVAAVPGFQDSRPQKGVIYTESQLEAIRECHQQDSSS